jgi:hypothetical protein
MDDLERLRLLRDLLIKRQLTSASSLGELANDVESILISIEEVPGGLKLAYVTLWEALEILGVKHQEAGTQPTAIELADLAILAERLKKEADKEITTRGG